MYFYIDLENTAKTFMTSCITAFVYIFLTVIFPTGTLTVALLNVQNLYFRNNKEKKYIVFSKQWCGECVRRTKLHRKVLPIQNVLQIPLFLF